MAETAAFERIVGALDYPMFVVTTRAADGTRAGCLVGFASQLSIDPPRFLAGLSKRNHTFRTATQADRLAIHVLAAEHRDIAELFGERTGDDVDKFAHCAWTPDEHGMPILAESAAWFAGPIVDRVDLGDHVGFLVAPDSGAAPRNISSLLTYAAVRDLVPGHTS